MRTIKKFIPGFVVVVLLTLLAFFFRKYLEFNVNLLAISLGFVAGNLYSFKAGSKFGFKWLEYHGLAIAVALLGAQLNLSLLLNMDLQLIGLIISGLLFTFLITFLTVKVLRVGNGEAILVACGQGICGSAAVMAVQRVTQAPANKAALIVVVVNFLGFLGVFLAPLLASICLDTDTNSSGLFIGNTLQSMGHVVAAGFSVDDMVGETAVLVKMSRILMLVPLLLVLVLFYQRKKNTPKKNLDSWYLFSTVPWFIWGFLTLLLVTNVWILPQPILDGLKSLCDVIFVVAMVAIGLGVRLADLRADGKVLLLLTCLVFSAQLAFSLAYLS